MFDIVVVAMFIVLPVLAWSILVVKRQRNYQLHKRIQIGLGAVLLVAVTCFELDIRLHPQWKESMWQSPRYDLVRPLLSVHLFFSISTTLLWIVTIIAAWRRFPNPPVPGLHSRLHKRLAWAATIDMFCTAITGWTFYYLAFVIR